MTEPVEIIRQTGRVEIILNRPEKKNALTSEMYAAMADALAFAEEDAAVLAVVIAARGETFCAGNDLGDFLNDTPDEGDKPVMRFLRAIAELSKVVVAAVQGKAIGVGATMLLHCDHVIATDDAELRFAFVKVGLVPEAASSLLLPRAIGHLRAAELMLTGDPLPAAEALSYGLVSRVVPAGEQLDQARAFAGRFEQSPPQALRATKQLLRSSSTGVAERMAEEAVFVRRQLASREFRDVAAAFFKR